MPDTTITVTANTVQPSSAAVIRTGTTAASTTIIAGDILYLTSGGLLAKAITTTVVTAAVVGIALNGGGGDTVGQVIRYVAEDPLLTMTTTAALTVGAQLFLSDTAGKMTQTPADVNAGEFYTGLGTAITATTLNFKITKSGVAHA